MKVPAEYKVKLTGVALGSYVIEEKIWQGATSTVYRAKGNQAAPFGSVVAIKVLHPYRDSPVYQRQFLWEASLLRKLRHPNVIRAYETGRLENLLFFYMEFVHGESLRQIMTERELTLEQCFYFILEIGKALSYIHTRGIIHRDIKPENILISLDFSEVKVIDFGYAGYLRRHWWQKDSSLVGGTQPYMAPELARGEGDQRCDIFSLGVIIGELLVPRLDRRQEVLKDIIHRATHPLVWKRFSTVGQLLQACHYLFQDVW